MITGTTINQFNSFFFFLVIVVGTWLGLWVYFANRKAKVNKLFASMVIMWLVGVVTPYYIFRTFVLPQGIIHFLPRLEVSFVFLFFIPFYFFTIYFLKEEKKLSFFSKLLVPVVSLGALLALTTNLFQKEVLMINGRGLDLILTLEGKVAWLGFVILMNLFILSRFLINYFKVSAKEKLKIQYFLIGISIWILIGFVFLIYPPLFRDTFKYAFWGNYGIIFLFFFTAYAIVKRELFGIKTVFTTLLIGLIAILLFADFFFFTELLWLRIAKGIMLLLFLGFGWLLIKSIVKEVKQREKLEKLANDLEKANRELKKLDHAKSEFLSIASHQLRTPLTAMRGYLSMLLQGDFGPLSPKVKEVSREVYQASLRLLKLSNDLLNVSQIESGKTALQYEEVPIGELVSAVIHAFQAEAQKKGLCLKFEKNGELGLVEIDKEKIRQVILNIIDNAIRYTKKGSIKVKIDNPGPDKTLIVVQDTGAGLTKKDIQKLFQSFSRGQAGSSLYSAGSGLGLYVARKFVDQHRGRLWAESLGRDKGSTFFIELPVKKPN